MNDNNNAVQPEIVQPAHWGITGTLVWGVVIAIVFIMAQAAVMMAVVMARTKFVSADELEQAFADSVSDGFVLSVATLITTMLCCGLIAGIIKLKKNSVLKEYLCIRPVPAKTMLQWTVILAVFIALTNALALALGRPIVTDFMADIYASAHPVWLLWLALIVAAPIFEETFFRGFLYRGLASGFPGPAGAVFITSVLWAVIHTQYDTHDKIVIFCLGLLLGTVRQRTGSLLAPMGLHALSNLEATIEAALLG